MQVVGLLAAQAGPLIGGGRSQTLSEHRICVSQEQKADLVHFNTSRLQSDTESVEAFRKASACLDKGCCLKERA